MTRYVCAPDSFKESLTAPQAAQAMAEGIRRGDPAAEIRLKPMADGGEGTARALVDATHGVMRSVTVRDPLGRPVRGEYGLLGDGEDVAGGDVAGAAAGRTAVVETASASGLSRLAADERDPLVASSYGTGELIRAAAHAGATRIIVGLGGSATNDAGSGLLAALGVRLLDGSGRPLAPGGAALADLATIDMSGLDEAVQQAEIVAACDVTNPLTGPHGASAVFGPQKGASPADVERLDDALARFARIASATPGLAPALGEATDFAASPGAGAAGGIGFALLAFLGAKFRPGVDLVVEQSGLDAAVRWADVVLTGEGSVDAQTAFGKTPAGVASVAKRHGKPVVALAGHVGDGIDGLYGLGVDAVFGIAPGASDLQTLLHGAAGNVSRTCEQVARLVARVRHG
ncbi:glycerate kinase family protein [Bifidobacterium leontopitheci]|uniref:Glycerate kinase n=1 Tax=Bifidobacterium leontopitheci TaxID=2650774 RepID=A0A6I1GI95_9BIFI|nr:glycerate kinase [Bifidobacterium leontopitheci]KAB7791390.1 glycerate kinase [Bifidobacterium leontopitheci]